MTCPRCGDIGIRVSYGAKHTNFGSHEPQDKTEFILSTCSCERGRKARQKVKRMAKLLNKTHLTSTDKKINTKYKMYIFSTTDINMVHAIVKGVGYGKPKGLQMYELQR